MGRKWNGRDWYQYHKGKASQAAAKSVGAKERRELDEIDEAIRTLDAQLEVIRTNQSVAKFILSALFSTR